MKGTAWKEVWDFDYLSTSDEEDNEDTSDDGSLSSESCTDSDEVEEGGEKKEEVVEEKKVEDEKKDEKKDDLPADLDNRHHPRKRVKKIIDKFETDVVINLIKKDEGLLIRDKAARLLKIQYRNHVQKKIFTFSESTENTEDWKGWWSPTQKNVYFAMNSRHRTCYRKGDQLFNSYGLRTNRFLLNNYGFSLR